MKKISKSQRFMEHIMDHPNAKVATVAKKFGIAASLGYQLRKKALANQIGVFAPPELLPVPEPIKVAQVDATLDTRAQSYGKFKDGAALMQSLKRSMADHAAKHGKSFADDQWEALEMIVHKIGRIINGDPDHVDSWMDIAGYATLVADRLQGYER